MPSKKIKKPAARKRDRKLTRRDLAPKEDGFQKAAAEFLERALPDHATFVAFPAGGGGVIRGKKLKAMGLKPGWPDIQILVRASSFDQAARSFSRFIGFECKREFGGVVSVDQKNTHLRISVAGGIVYIVRTLDEIYHHLTVDEGLRLRAKIGA